MSPAGTSMASDGGPPAREMYSRAWSAETLNAALETVSAQQCKQEPATPESSRQQRIKD